MWQLVSQINFMIKVKRAWKPLLQCKNDLMLMQFFINLKFSPTQLKTLNRCRILLQVITLLDISSADGTTIDHPILQGDRLIGRKNTLSWPCQQCPQQSDWNVWSLALEHLQHNNSLCTILTEWTSSSHQSWF
jgi:hypothetical protein